MTGRRVLVTGASRGIGAACCRMFAQAGATVLVQYFASGQKAAEVLADLKRLSAHPHAIFRCDVTRRSQIKRLFNFICAQWGGLDCLVNNAGVWVHDPLSRLDEERLEATFAVNVVGPFLCAREAIPMLESLHTRFPRNFLVLFELSQMYADMGDRGKALAPLDKIEKLKRTGAPGFQTLPEARIEFARGNLLFWFKQFDLAISELERATAHAELLDPNSGPSAWLRLGQCYDIKERRADALRCYERAVAFTPSGDPAKEAKHYISSAFSLEQMKDIQRETKLRKP